jgi:hypothetical protein
MFLAILAGARRQQRWQNLISPPLPLAEPGNLSFHWRLEVRAWMCYYPPLPLLPAVALAKVEARVDSAFFQISL